MDGGGGGHGDWREARGEGSSSLFFREMEDVGCFRARLMAKWCFFMGSEGGCTRPSKKNEVHGLVTTPKKRQKDSGDIDSSRLQATHLISNETIIFSNARKVLARKINFCTICWTDRIGIGFTVVSIFQPSGSGNRSDSAL